MRFDIFGLTVSLVVAISSQGSPVEVDPHVGHGIPAGKYGAQAT